MAPAGTPWEALGAVRDLDLNVRGRKTGRWVSRPVWFVIENGLLFFIPVDGPRTQWYLNILKNPDVGLSVGGSEFRATLSPLLQADRVKHVVELFTERYGKRDIAWYYSDLTVAAEGSLSTDGNP